MALLECPTRNDLPSFSYLIRLDGVNYTLAYNFNPRMNNGVGKWMLSVGDQLGNIIVAPVPIVATWPLFDRFIDQAIFPGSLLCFDSSGQDLDPGQFALGARCRIFYLEVGS